MDPPTVVETSWGTVLNWPVCFVFGKFQKVTFIIHFVERITNIFDSEHSFFIVTSGFAVSF